MAGADTIVRMAAGLPPGCLVDGPLGFLITFACYGQRLHGDPRWSVDRFHNQPGAQYVPKDFGRAEYALRAYP